MSIADEPARDGQPSPSQLHRYLHRHAATQHAMRLLVPNDRLTGGSAAVSNLVWLTAVEMTELLHDGPELTAGLRKLLEAKDCLVRQALLDEGVLSDG
jgi:hypothetical protein